MTSVCLFVQAPEVYILEMSPNWCTIFKSSTGCFFAELCIHRKNCLPSEIHARIRIRYDTWTQVVEQKNRFCILILLYCSKHNEINSRFPDPHKYVSQKKNINDINLLLTGSHKKINMHYRISIEMSKAAFLMICYFI